jgi:hypothetical protein
MRDLSCNEEVDHRQSSVAGSKPPAGISASVPLLEGIPVIAAEG